MSVDSLKGPRGHTQVLSRLTRRHIGFHQPGCRRVAMPVGRDGFGKAGILDDTRIPLADTTLDGPRAMVQDG